MLHIWLTLLSAPGRLLLRLQCTPTMLVLCGDRALSIRPNRLRSREKVMVLDGVTVLALLTRLLNLELLLLLSGARRETGLCLHPRILRIPLIGTLSLWVSLLGAGLCFRLRSTRCRIWDSPPTILITRIGM